MKHMYIKLFRKTKILSTSSHKLKTFLRLNLHITKNTIIRRNYNSKYFIFCYCLYIRKSKHNITIIIIIIGVIRTVTMKD